MVVTVVVVVVVSLLIVVVVVGVSVALSDVLFFDLSFNVFLLELNILLFFVETADVDLYLFNWGIFLQSKSNLQQLLQGC